MGKATLFDVTQSFTSNWPKTMWFAVDQRGVHLLEFRTRNVLTSYEYDSILDYTPSLNHMLLITGSDKKQSKIIVTTNQAFQISNLIREYIEVLHKYGSSDDNASRNLRSIYGPGIAALYQHQAPQRHANQDDMYMMHNTTTANEVHHYQATRPAPIIHK